MERMVAMSKWEPLQDDTPINYDTVSRMRLKPGGSNIDIYVDAPVKQMKPKIQSGLSPSRRYEFGKDR